MKRLAELERFNAIHKKRSTYRECQSNLVEKYRDRVPDVLLQSWIEHGFQEFSDGFLWTVDPDAHRRVIAGFLHEEQVEDVDVLLRTGLGDMIVRHKGRFVHFSAVTLRHGELTGSFESILEMELGTRRFLNSIFFLDMFKQARKRLGKLSEDEVYGFSTPLGLGGEMDSANLTKVNLRVYFDRLSELQPRR